MWKKFAIIVLLLCIAAFFVWNFIRSNKKYDNIFKAVEAGNIHAVKSFIHKNPELIHVKDKFGATLLHIAAWKGRNNITCLLLQRGADANAKDNEGFTPLHIATRYKHKKSVELLIKNNANVNTSSNGGFSPLHVAARYGCTKIIKLLLKSGANINAKDNEGLTPLHYAERDYAEREKHKDSINLLKKHGIK